MARPAVWMFMGLLAASACRSDVRDVGTARATLVGEVVPSPFPGPSHQTGFIAVQNDTLGVFHRLVRLPAKKQETIGKCLRVVFHKKTI